MKFLHHYRNAFIFRGSRLSDLLFALTSIFLVLQFISPTLTDASPTFNEYPITTNEYSPNQMITGSDGNMWYMENYRNGAVDQIGRVTTSGTVSDYNVTPSGAVATAVHGIANGPSGDIWFTACVYTSSSSYPAVGYITPSTGVTTMVYQASPGTYCNFGSITEGSDGNLYAEEGTYIVQITSSGTLSIVYGMAPSGSNFPTLVNGPDNNLWFVNAGQNKVGMMNISTDAVTTYTVPTSSSYPTGITNGPDGNLWFTESSGNKIGKITTSGSITEYSIPTTGAGAESITAGPDGALWFTESNNDGSLGRITTTGHITEYLTPTDFSSPYGISTGPDNALWFTESGANQVGRISAAPFFNEYSTTSSTEYAPSDIVTGSDGNMWYRENNRNGGTDQIGRITTSGTVSDYDVTPSGAVAASVDALTNGPSGDIWFTSCVYTSSSSYPAVGYITPSTGVATMVYQASPGTYCNFNTDGLTTGSDGNLYTGEGTYIVQITPSGTRSIVYGMAPSGSSFPSLTTGPDGNLWFVNAGQNKVGVMNISTDAVTTYSIPTSSSSPRSIVSGSDGNLWFIESNGNSIGKITTSGSITEYAIPTSGAGADSITAGSDGALWFTESNNDGTIGRITTSGSITEYLTPTDFSGPYGITAGPDDALWFTETSANQIGRIGY